MLMDEPFGAIDPITRERLQNEFLRLHQQIRKTIIFVTHDIDEAIKMGDKIAVLRDQSHIAQFDTPENILTSPADDYVADFIGAGASLKRLNLSRVRDLEVTSDAPTGSTTEDPAELQRRLGASDWSAMLLLDGRATALPLGHRRRPAPQRAASTGVGLAGPGRRRAARDAGRRPQRADHLQRWLRDHRRRPRRLPGHRRPRDDHGGGPDHA